MAEELVSILEKFDLNSKKKEGSVIIIIEDLYEDVKECEQSLIGKVLGEKIVNFNEVKNYVIS